MFTAALLRIGFSLQIFRNSLLCYKVQAASFAKCPTQYSCYTLIFTAVLLRIGFSLQFFTNALLRIGFKLQVLTNALLRIAVKF